MDRGAARSRKRLLKAEKTSEPTTSRPLKSLPKGKNGPGGPKGPKGKDGRINKGNDVPESKRHPKTEGADADEAGDNIHPDRRQDPNPELYKPKAIRTSAAMVFSQAPFEIPPPPERLAGVTRIDLEGSGCTDVSWLAGSGVTWLSVKGCRITEGWEALGGLEGLSVLNISDCALDALPPALASLSKLKALVAMNNDWTELDADVVAGWKELNSLIISHSPNLASLPASLASLPQLSKLTFSHCPYLSSGSLPDLSALPLLRDVRANNLPRLTALPSHIVAWGTGDLALAKVAKTKGGDADADADADKPRPGRKTDDTPRRGDGLDALDLGNCSLPFSAVATLFALAPTTAPKPKHTWNLRSLTLQANPLALEQPTYADLLRASPAMPKLQIIDSRRVVERKRAGTLPETKAERRARVGRERKMQPTGANARAQGKMREWGKRDGDDGEDEARVDVEERERGERKERKERGERKERVDRKDRSERKERGDRGERKERKDGDRGKKRTRDETDERPAKAPKAARADRVERAERAERPAKPKPATDAFFDDGEPADGKRKRKRTRDAEREPVAAPVPAPTPKPTSTQSEPETSEGKKKRKRKHGKRDEAEGAPATAAAQAPPPKPSRPAKGPKVQAPVPTDPSAVKAKKPSRSETAVVGVVDVRSAGGLDLKAALSADVGSGLDVGGW